MKSSKIKFVDEVAIKEKKKTRKVGKYYPLYFNRAGMKKYTFCNARKSTFRLICLVVLLYTIACSVGVCLGLLCCSPYSRRELSTAIYFVLSVPLLVCPLFLCVSPAKEILLDDKKRSLVIRSYNHFFGFVEFFRSVKMVTYADLEDFQVRRTRKCFGGSALSLEVVDRSGEKTQLSAFGVDLFESNDQETLMMVGQKMKDLVLRRVQKSLEIAN